MTHHNTTTFEKQLYTLSTVYDYANSKYAMVVIISVVELMLYTQLSVLLSGTTFLSCHMRMMVMQQYSNH